MASFDPVAVIDQQAPGVEVTRDRVDAIYAAWVANGRKPLSDQQVVNAVGPLPPPVTSLSRIGGYDLGLCDQKGGPVP